MLLYAAGMTGLTTSSKFSFEGGVGVVDFEGFDDGFAEDFVGFVVVVSLTVDVDEEPLFVVDSLVFFPPLLVDSLLVF